MAPSGTVSPTARGRRATTVAVIAMVVAGAAIAALATAAQSTERPPADTRSGSACGPAVNAIVCENRRPGAPPWEWDVVGVGDPTIQGFATDISVDNGRRIDFKIDTDASAYHIDIYRTGWYQGLGARKVASILPMAHLPQHQPPCLTDAATELYDCGTWAVSATWDVPADAVSGVYVAKLIRGDDQGASHIIFVVRDDGGDSDVLFQTSDPTWQAYNPCGGANLYQGNVNPRGYKVSYNRPFLTRGSNKGRDFYFSAEYATVRFLERNGYDLAYQAGVDTDRAGGALRNHRVFLSVGHDEYWSGAQRRNVEAARDAGVNLQFLSGNSVYWRTRYEPSIDASRTAYRTLVSYKETWANGRIDPTEEWTGTWRDPRFSETALGGGQPENSLTGTMYTVNQDDLAVTVSAEEGRFRLWRHTGLDDLAPGTTATLAAHTIGYESGEDVDNGERPAGLIRLSTTIGWTDEYLEDYGTALAPARTAHHLTLYRAASGALVFSAASIQWGWGLDGRHDGAGPAADIRMQQAQVNLLADMRAQPGSLMEGLVSSPASADTAAPASTIITPAAEESIPSGSSVTVTGTASDVGGEVAGVEVSTDGGLTWHPASGTTAWRYTYFQQGSGRASVIARAIDDSANVAAVGATRTVTVTGPYSAFGQVAPRTPSSADRAAVELGLRFTALSDGFVTGVRFYKGLANRGTHVGSLWDADGRRVATATFSDETASGWQSAAFADPVPVLEGQSFTASYTAPEGGYAVEARYWPYRARSTSPVGIAGGVGPDAPGVYGPPGTRPVSTSDASNYFVDVLFTTSDASSLRILSQTPADGVSSVASDTAVTATFTRDADAATVGMAVTTARGVSVAGGASYDPATRTVRFAPAAPLAAATTYIVTIAAQDTTGVPLAHGSNWSFTTRGTDRPAGACPCSLFPESRTPAIASDADAERVTVGVGFIADEPGAVTAIRFYKGPANTGVHTGALWDSSGKKLAAVTFTGESAAGWQTATLSVPVAVTPGVRYVASYTAPDGHPAVDPGAYASAYSRGPLTVEAGGAVWTYSLGFPHVASTSDFGVDVVFGPSMSISGASRGMDVKQSARVSESAGGPTKRFAHGN